LLWCIELKFQSEHVLSNFQRSVAVGSYVSQSQPCSKYHWITVLECPAIGARRLMLLRMPFQRAIVMGQGKGFAMTGIAEWLASKGLGEYAQRFAENAIDLSVVGDLTQQDLKDLGVLVGHRRKMLRAIAELKGDGLGAPPGSQPAPQRIFEAELYRLKARVLLLRGAPDAEAEAQSLLDDALSTARSQHAKALELRAATDRAALWIDQGRREEARDLLAPIYAWFTEGFDTQDLKQAKALLDQVR
jgi:hypothetical protein